MPTNVFVHLTIILVMGAYNKIWENVLLKLYRYHVICFCLSRSSRSSSRHNFKIIIHPSHIMILTLPFEIVELSVQYITTTQTTSCICEHKQTTEKVEKEKQMKTWTNNRKEERTKEKNEICEFEKWLSSHRHRHLDDRKHTKFESRELWSHVIIIYF